jgi:IPT/TIG domain
MRSVGRDSVGVGRGWCRTLAVMAAFGSVSLGVLSVAPAGPTAADVTGDTASAYGVQVAGLVSLAATPSVTTPGQSATLASLSLPGVLTTGVLSVQTTSSAVPGPDGKVTGSAQVAGVNLVAGALTATAVSTTCSSAASGSSAQTTITGLEVAGVPVTLPATIPVNFGLTVPGLGTVELNHQVRTDALGGTSITVDGLYAQLLGGLSTITVAHSACGVTGPDVEAPPTVTSIVPTSGPSTGGTSVTVHGTDLAGATSVSFGTTPATDVVVDSAGQLTAVAPAGTGVTDVTVTTPFGTSATTPADQYTYTNAPTVTSVSPNAGPAAGGTSVTLTGTGLADVSSVQFGATPATAVTCSATSCSVTSPAGTAGDTVPVTVTSPEGTSVATPADQFSYGNLPAVDSLVPDAGPAAGGTSVTITGANLAGATSVQFGATPGTIVGSCSATSCSVTSPAGTAGATVPVTVTTGSGTSVPSPSGDFTYYATPSVSSVSPSTGPIAGGTSVTITGTGLCGATGVDFGATPAASFTVNQSCTQINATSPSGNGTVDVTVTTPGGTSPDNPPADSFTYAPQPTVASILPTSGPTAGGTAVQITGTGLTGATAITFGATPSPQFSCTSDSSCTATAPPGTGTVPVMVTTAGGTSSGPAGDFTYIAPYPFFALSPYRIVDTRAGSGEPYSGQTLGPNGSLDIQVTGTGSGSDSVPANATVVVLNVTEATATAASFLTVYPTGDARPLASSLDFVPNDVIPNLVEVAVGTGGKVTLYNSAGATDVAVDVEGFVGPPPGGSGTTGLFNPLSPARLADTRTGSGEPYAGDTLGSGMDGAANSTLNVQVTGQGGVPSTGVSAVVLNVTSTNATAPTWLAVYPQGSTRPFASNVNNVDGSSQSTRVVVPVGPTGEISVFNWAGNNDVVVDVNGWFTSATGGTGNTYSGFSPQRIADTRPSSGQPYAGDTIGPNHSLTIQIAGTGGVPAMSSANPPSSVVLNVTVTNTTSPSWLTAYPADETLPLASDLNWNPGVTKANMVVVKLSSAGAITLYNYQGSTDVVVDVAGFYS